MKYIKCPYCEKTFKSLSSHLKVHNKSLINLKHDFPNHKIISDETKEKIIKWQHKNKKKSDEEIKNFLESIGYVWIGNEYKNIYSKLKVQCSNGHISEIRFDQLQSGHRCHECHNQWKKKNFSGKGNPNWKGGYTSNNVPTYDSYSSRIEIAEDIRRNLEDNNILEVKCTYCGNWYIPTISSVMERIRSLDGRQPGENRLYCSDMCKTACSIYRQIKFPRDFKTGSSREVQAELRQLKFKIDNYTCQKCKKHKSELLVPLHCHHLEGIKWGPLESADVDKCITVCEICHKEIHKKENCKYNDLKC